jgi:hypothetical protein
MSSVFNNARDIGRDLIRLVHSFLPMTIAEADGDPVSQLQWIPVRLTGTLESVLSLGEGGQHEDSAALVRVMTDHLIVFAWLLADPQAPDRTNAWKNDDIRLINVSRQSLKRLGVEVEAPPQGIGSSATLVNAETAANECDEFWGPQLAPFFKSGTLNSFSGLYAAVFRGTSPYVHPSLRGSMGFFTTPKGGAGKMLRINKSYADIPGTYVQAVVIHLLAVWILVARFRHRDVDKVVPFFDRVIAMNAASPGKNPGGSVYK